MACIIEIKKDINNSIDKILGGYRDSSHSYYEAQRRAKEINERWVDLATVSRFGNDIAKIKISDTVFEKVANESFDSQKELESELDDELGVPVEESTDEVFDNNIIDVSTIKPGVEDLFESNPELANEVYESLGYDSNEFSLVLKQEEENQEGIMLGEYDIVYKNNSIGNVFLPLGYKNYTIKGIAFKEQYLNKGLGKAFYKWLGNKADIENATLHSDFDNTSESAKRVWESLKKENLAVDAQMGYKFSPKNLKQQAQQLYSQYIDTIFPDSKVKDIVYHHSSQKIEKFDKSFLGKETGAPDTQLGFFFAEDKNDIPKMVVEKNKQLEEIGESRRLNFSVQNNVLLNIKNPEYYYGFLESAVSNILNREVKVTGETAKQDFKDARLKLKNNNKDALVYGLSTDYNDGDHNVNHGFVILEPENIYVLGSKQDIEGFKQYVDAISVEEVEEEHPIQTAYKAQLEKTGEKPKMVIITGTKAILNSNGTYDLVDPSNNSIMQKNMDLDTMEIIDVPDTSMPYDDKIFDNFVKNTLMHPYTEVMLAERGIDINDVYDELSVITTENELNEIMGKILKSVC